MKAKRTFFAHTDPKIRLLYLLSLFILNICVNSFMKIKLLCLDNLNTWSEFSKMSTLQMIFNTSANKFRPVYYFVLNLCYKLFLPRVYLFGFFNLMLNFLVVILIFYVIKKITGREFVAFFGSVIYIVSRFAYYAISQVHGIMEQMALGVAVLIFFLLWRYIEQNNKKQFYIACFLMFMAPLIHERYLIMFPMFILAIILAPKSDNFEKLKCFAVSILSFIIPFLARVLILKNRAFDGTGGTDMKETFRLLDFYKHFKSGVRYLFGINDGPAYLNGIEQSAVLQWVKDLNLIFIMGIFIITCLYFFLLVKNKNRKDEVKKQLKLNAFVLSFIVLTLICACVTIRLEMRWLYTPYVGFIILISNMIAYISVQIKPYFCIAMILSLLSIIIPTELYFRGHYKNIYYWGHYQIYNSLFDQTVTRYKDNLLNKKVIIASEHADIFGDHAEALQKSFSMIDPNRTLNIELFNDVSKVPQDYYHNNANVILTIDSYNQKVVNLKDIR